MPESLQDRIDAAGGIPQYPNHSVTPLVYPYPPAYTNWRDEQRAWHDTAVLFDQSYHMVDLYIKGPDTFRLLSDTAANTFKNFGRNKAKQYLAVNEDGFVAADAILFGLEDDEVSVVGTQVAPDWLKYHAEKGGRSPHRHGKPARPATPSSSPRPDDALPLGAEPRDAQLHDIALGQVERRLHP